MILDIITHAEDEQYQDNLLMVKDAYLCLGSVVAIGMRIYEKMPLKNRLSSS